jgi:hypothetical protein
MVDKPKRSYYLPGKLVDVVAKDAAKSGYIKEKMVAAAMFEFLSSSPDARAKMFNRLESFLASKKK